MRKIVDFYFNDLKIILNLIWKLIVFLGGEKQKHFNSMESRFF